MLAIFVSGATGNIGKEVVNQLTSKGVKVRAAVQLEEKAKFLKGFGAETVVVDFNDVKSIANGLQGVEKAFSMSPFVPNLGQFGINFVEAAKRAGLKYIVRSSGMGADLPQPITLLRWHREAEKAVEESGIPYTILRPNVFMQNYVNFYSHNIKANNAFYLPQGDGKISLIDVRDIASVIVEIITKGGHEGKAYSLTGPEAVSNYTVAEILSKETGRTINYIDVPEDTARKNMKEMGMPDAIVEAVLELSAFIKAGNTARVSPSVEQITGRKPRSFQQFVRDHIEFFK